MNKGLSERRRTILGAKVVGMKLISRVNGGVRDKTCNWGFNNIVSSSEDKGVLKARSS